MKMKKKRNHLPFRLNTLFFIVFVLFSVLIIRLGVIQLVYGEEYSREVAKTEETTVEASVPRGLIKDRNQNIIVDNKSLRAITFTRKSSMTTEELLEIATDLSQYIKVSTKKITERDLKDYWLVTRKDEAENLTTAAEKKAVLEGDMENSDFYKLQIKRITEDQLKTITKKEKQILAIKIAMTSGYANTPVIVKKNATQEEYAKVSENLENLEGVDVGTDWERKYMYGDTFRTILGNITNANEGLPSENLDYYLARDYKRNDRVGKSYIESEYEAILRGQKEQVRNITDKSNTVIGQEVIRTGERGKDLVLTIDMELQQEVEKIIEEELRNTRASSYLTDRAFVVMMDPNTGEVLSMAGKQLVTKDGKTEVQDYALGTFTSAYVAGSVVKGATLAAGYGTGKLSPGEVILDSPIKIQNTPLKKSWKTFGMVNDINALKVSSNVYMFKTAMKIANANYVYDQPLPIDNTAFTTMRNYYAQFGLGVPTGINLPNEFSGIKGTELLPGKLLDLSIGQYDTYTTLQLAQYVSAIANGGYRLQPQIVKEIRSSTGDSPNESDQVLHSVEANVLNKVDITESNLKRIQEGFRQVMQVPGGTGYAKFAGVDYNPAGKTGTAETFYDGPRMKEFSSPVPIYNLSYIGYAPFDKPEVAFSVIVPWVSGNSTPNSNISKRILDTYFDLKEKKNKETKNEENTQTETNQ